jgi:ferrochelatase
MTTGLLLVNLGTPRAPTTAEVRRYLRQFLSDPRVIDIHPIARALLLNLIILPFRSSKSAAAYAKIWDGRGSPLLAHSQDLTAGVAERLGSGWRVELGMRYGDPSIASAVDRLRAAAVDRIVVFPLYPQYASSSSGSSIEEVFRILRGSAAVPSLSVIGAFYDDPGFLAAFAAVGSGVIASEAPDHVLLSFHGLPERHVKATDATGAHCLASGSCCESMVEANRDCYRAQCYATARGLATRLGLAPERWSVSFQSRLGRTPWIRPYTDEVLPQLAAAGKKKVVVFCPAFVADCLETVEEIGMRGRESFLAAGGTALTLVPSLNATPAWSDAVVTLARRHAAGRD